jgi:uncharacterized protein YutE (UPF0331/DUF86 family)
VRTRGLKYTFVTAIEGCVNVAQHICATEGWGRQSITATPSGRSASTASALLNLPGPIRQALGFRHVLVHDYIRVNDEIVIDRLKALTDLEDFVSQVESFVTNA